LSPPDLRNPKEYHFYRLNERRTKTVPNLDLGFFGVVAFHFGVNEKWLDSLFE